MPDWSLAETPEQQAFVEAVSRLAARWSTDDLRRSLADGSELPSRWTELATLGVDSLLIPEQSGGGGGSVADAAAVMEPLGYSLASGPVAAGMVALATLAATDRTDLVDQIVAGDALCSVALNGHLVPDGGGRWSGTARQVHGLHSATHVLVPFAGRCRLVSTSAEEVQFATSVDPTRGVGTLRLSGAPAELLSMPFSQVRSRVLILLAAESVGAATWCLETAVEHAKSREQFGRPIGQFQAVKHRCADMLVTIERATAAVRDAARRDDTDDQLDLAAVIAVELASRAHVFTATACIQILGGVGFTWEHDAHLYLRRALVDRHVLAGCGADVEWIGDQVLNGRECAPRAAVDSEPRLSDKVRSLMTAVDDVAQPPTRQHLSQLGLVVPEWARPWGVDASSEESAAIDAELSSRGITRPDLRSARWVLPAIIGHGTDEQCERWVRPALEEGELWCQMFSEPGAGSDLAALSCRADRTADGWEVTGQKIWVSDAEMARWGMCLLRTETHSARHAGISCLVVDLHAPGVDIRPIRDLVGAVHFFEIFLDAVPVPSDYLIGDAGSGWAVARTMMQSERDFMGGDWSFGEGVRQLLPAMVNYPFDTDALRRIGQLAADEYGVRALAERARAGRQRHDAEASIRKLLAAQHAQAITELGCLLAGRSPVSSTDFETWSTALLESQGLTIGGGTPEMQRNEISQRLLQLPRDP